MNKTQYKLLGLLFAFIYFTIWNIIKDVEGYSYCIGVMTMFIYFMIQSLGDKDE